MEIVMKFLRNVLLGLTVFASVSAIANQESESQEKEFFLSQRRPIYLDPNLKYPLCSEGTLEGYCRMDGTVSVQVRLPAEGALLSAKEFEDIVLALGVVERLPVQVSDRYILQSRVWNERKLPSVYSLQLKVPVGKEAKFCAAYLLAESIKDAALDIQQIDCRQPLGGNPNGSGGVRN
jgi:hypothetical protein